MGFQRVTSSNTSPNSLALTTTNTSTIVIRFVLVAILVACARIRPARAEYRVFVLKIEDSTSGQSRTVTTTLDHMQYTEYYPVRASEKVSIQETWMCRNRSDISQDIKQKYCPNPRGPASATAPPPAPAKPTQP